MTRPWLTLALALLMTGCAARGFVQQGELHARQGNWVAAHGSYARASGERPGSAKLAALAEDARLAALQQLQARYEVASSGGDLPAAFQTLLDAYDIGSEQTWVTTAFNNVARRRNQQSDDALAAGRLDDAYGLAVQTREWFPKREPVEDRVRFARQAMEMAAREALMRESFDDAQRLAERILFFEPGQQAVAQALLGDVHVAWANQARTQARSAARRGRHGEALARGALVAKLSPAASDQNALRQYRDRFLTREGLVFDIEVRGADRRTRPIRQQFAAAVAGPPGVSWQPDAVAATIRGTLRLTEPACSQSRETRPARHTYVAGVVQVPNPEYTRLIGLNDELDSYLRTVRRDLRTQDQVLAVAREDLEYARADAVPLQRELVLQQRRVDEAITSQSRAIQALEDAEAAAREVRDHETTRASLQRRVTNLEQQEAVQDRQLAVAKRALAALPGPRSTKPLPHGKPLPKTGTRPATSGRPATPRAPGERPAGARPPRPTPGQPAPEPAPAPNPAPSPSPAPVPDAVPAPPAPPVSPERLAAQEAVEHAASQLQATRTALAAARAERAGLARPSPVVQRLAEQVPQRARALDLERRDEVERRYVQLENRLGAVREVIAQRSAYVADQQRALNQIIGQKRQVAGEVEQARIDLSRTPPTLGQEVLDTYDYDVERWTRSCTVRAELNTRSTAVPGVQRALSFTYETTDEAFDAVPSVGLQGDPLAFPSSDADLIQRGDQDLVAQVRPILEDQVVLWRQAKVRSGESSAAETKTRALLAAWMVDPSQPLPALDAHLREAYGLDDVTAITR